MPILLADIGGIFAIGFLLISFIGWIINLINAQNPPAAPNRGQQPRPRARDRKVQNEIEEFLQEAMGNRRQPRDEVRPDEIEVLEPVPQRRPPTNPRPRPQSAPAKVVRRVSVTKPAKRRRPGGEVSARHVARSQEMGNNVSSHVQQHMNERVGQESAQHLSHLVDESVTQHLGVFTAAENDPRASVKTSFRSRANVPGVAALISELRTPAGMRKAVLLQEILAKPRILRDS